MDLLDKVIELDTAYLETFTNCIERPWGSLFYNEAQPDYYDANHAHVSKVPENPEKLVQEVLAFYKEKNLIPRLYIHQPERQKELVDNLHAAGFRSEELEGPVQLWDNALHIEPLGEEYSIEEVTESNLAEAIAIEVSIKELGGSIREAALREEFKQPGFIHYLLRHKGIACSTACIFQADGQARLESVATLEAYRGKGLIGKLIRHIQQVSKDHGYSHLWVFPINEQVEKVYNRYGFQTLDHIKTIHAFAGGKSIKEIREGTSE